MAQKQMIYGPPKKGKSMYVLSMAKLGTIGIWDLEFGHDNYLRPHPTIPQDPGYECANVKCECHSGQKHKKPTVKAALRPHIAKMLDVSEETLIYWLQSQELSVGEAFLKAMGEKSEVIGVAMDSMSVHWDLVSDFADPNKPGGLAWMLPKRLERRLVYSMLSTHKHFIMTAHLQTIYNKDMQVVGTQAWAEKKMPYYLDFLGFMNATRDGKRSFVVEGERSGGVLKQGSIIENPLFEKVLELNGGEDPAHEVMAPLDEQAIYDSNARAAGVALGSNGRK